MNRRHIFKYAAGVMFALAVFVAGIFAEGLFQEPDMAERFGILSNCFLFPAVLIGGIGALSWIANEGTFDMLSYGFGTFLQFLHPQKKWESFYEYKMRKQENQKGWLKHYLVIGLVCFIASVICLILYNMV